MSIINTRKKKKKFAKPGRYVEVQYRFLSKEDKALQERYNKLKEADMAKQRISSIKTESQMGNIEYKPTKSVGPVVFNEVDKAWDATYRPTLITCIKAHPAITAKSMEHFAVLVTFNGNLERPEWHWNEEGFVGFGTWQLRDLALLLERKNTK
jgi:hypothetical protein